MDSTAPLLQVNHLNMHFGGIHALRSAQLKVYPNTITSLIGPNGAGKTTLFNCLTGFYRASQGEIILSTDKGPVSIAQLLGEALCWRHFVLPHQLLTTLYYKMFGGSHLVARAGIARTFQNIRIFKEMTLVENLLVAQHHHANRNLIKGLLNTSGFKQWEQHAIEVAYQWLERFQLVDQANQLAGSLPYGKQRHLEIARAMCTQPKLICLDEPAAGLNPMETQELNQMIVQLKDLQNMTVLLIEHDMSMVMEISDYIYVLDHGEVIASGSPSEIQQNPLVLEAYLGIERPVPTRHEKHAS